MLEQSDFNDAADDIGSTNANTIERKISRHPAIAGKKTTNASESVRLSSESDTNVDSAKEYVMIVNGRKIRDSIRDSEWTRVANRTGEAQQQRIAINRLKLD